MVSGRQQNLEPSGIPGGMPVGMMPTAQVPSYNPPNEFSKLSVGKVSCPPLRRLDYEDGHAPLLVFITLREGIPWALVALFGDAYSPAPEAKFRDSSIISTHLLCISFFFFYASELALPGVKTLS